MDGDAYGVSRGSDENVVPHPSTAVDYYLSNLLASHLSNPDLTPQEIAEASRLAAAAAAKAAKVARAVAEEKAAVAAKAVVAAKSALDLVASFPDQDRCLRKNMMQKHVPVELLYYKDGDAENPGVYEELPCRLQQALNSCGRLSMPRQIGYQVKSPSGCTGLRESLSPISSGHAISKKVCSNGGSDRVDEIPCTRGKDGLAVLDEADVVVRSPITRKRGRSKSK